MAHMTTPCARLHTVRLTDELTVSVSRCGGGGGGGGGGLGLLLEVDGAAALRLNGCCEHRYTQVSLTQKLIKITTGKVAEWLHYHWLNG